MLFMLFSTLFGQQSSIRGKVTDGSNNSPLIGANVILEGTNLGAATDDKGQYEIKNLKAGD